MTEIDRDRHRVNPRTNPECISDPPRPLGGAVPSQLEGAAPHHMTARCRRALEIRVAGLEAEQAAAANEFEELYECGKKIAAEMQEREHWLHVFYDLIDGGGRA